MTIEERLRNLEERISALEGARRTKRSKTTAPADLTPEEKRALLDWVRAPASRRGLDRADLVPHLRKLVDACLDFHRAKGNLQADWLATCRTWIRNEADGAFRRNTFTAPPATAQVPRAPIPDVREPGVDYDAERQLILQQITERKGSDLH